MNSKEMINIKDINFNDIKDIQKSIGDLVKSNELTLDQGKQLLKSLPELNWEKISKDKGDKTKKEIVNWISNMEINNVDEIKAVIGVMTKFDKDDYTKISSVLADAFIQDRESFFKALAKEDGYIQEMAYAFHDLDVYKDTGRSMFDDFMHIRNSKDLTDEEKSIAYKFIEALEACEG